MAYRRRRSVRRGPRGPGRQKIWVHDQAGTIPLVAPGNGIFAADLIVPSDWEREVTANAGPSKAMKGGARMEGMYLDLAFQFTNSSTPFAPLVPEIMLWQQSSGFLNLVSSQSTWNTTFQNQRVLLYTFANSPINGFTGSSSGLGSQTERARYQIKSKVRLNEMQIGLAVRVGVDVGAFDEATVIVGFRSLITVP